MDFWSDFLQKLVLAAVPVVVPFVVAWLVAKTRAAWKSVPAEVGYLVESAAQMAVQAAEQAGAAGYIADKKAYALGVAEKWLEANSIKVDLHLVDAAIESAVYESFNKSAK